MNQMVRLRNRRARTAELWLVVDALDLNASPLATDAGSVTGYVAIVDRHGKLHWHTTWDSAETPGSWLDWSLVDLDGDGSDELIEFGHNLSGHESISVMTIEDGVPGTRFTLPLSHRDGYWAREFPATSPCEGTYRFARGDRGVQLLEIVGHPNGEPDNVAQCASAGRHRYTWAGQQLQEIP